MGKEVKKVSQGRVRDRNRAWFPELSDKRKYYVLVCLVIMFFFE